MVAWNYALCIIYACFSIASNLTLPLIELKCQSNDMGLRLINYA